MISTLLLVENQALPGFQVALESFFIGVAEPLGNDRRGKVARQSLGSRPSKDRFGPGIPVCYAPPGIRVHDGVQGGIDDQASELFAFGEGGF